MIDMKKEYIKPTVEITLLEGEVLMQPTSAPGIVDGEASKEDALSTGRRGSWGNLWDKNY